MRIQYQNQLSLVIGRIRQFTARVPQQHSGELKQLLLDVMWAYGASIEDTDNEYCHTWDQTEPFDAQSWEWLSSDAQKLLQWIDGSKDLPE